MLLVDSNIIIYSYFAEYDYLKDILYGRSVFVSEISRIEVLGYHKLTFDEEIYHRDFFKVIPRIYPDPQIFDKTIQIRKEHNLKLGDSLLAATALVNDLTICTRNVSDFGRVENLRFFYPIR